MTSPPVDFSLVKKMRANDPFELSPKELLHWAVQDAEKGEFDNASTAIIIVWKRTPEGNLIAQRYSCGMTNVEMIGFLEEAKLSVIEEWRR